MYWTSWSELFISVNRSRLGRTVEYSRIPASLSPYSYRGMGITRWVHAPQTPETCGVTAAIRLNQACSMTISTLGLPESRWWLTDICLLDVCLPGIAIDTPVPGQTRPLRILPMIFLYHHFCYSPEIHAWYSTRRRYYMVAYLRRKKHVWEPEACGALSRTPSHESRAGKMTRSP